MSGHNKYILVGCTYDEDVTSMNHMRVDIIRVLDGVYNGKLNFSFSYFHKTVAVCKFDRIFVNFIL